MDESTKLCLDELLKKAQEKVNNGNTLYELEVRVKNIDLKTYKLLLNRYSEQYVANEKVHSTVSFYKDSNIRKEEYRNDGKTVYTEKKRIYKCDTSDIRVALSTETQKTEDDAKELNLTSFRRRRERTSFKMGNYQVDFTLVNGRDPEVEIEFLTLPKTKEEIEFPVRVLFNTLELNSSQEIIKHHNNLFIKSNDSRRARIYTKYFSKPVPIEEWDEDKMKELNTFYKVTDKLDGVNVKLFIHRSGLYLLTRKAVIPYIYSDNLSSLRDTVIDAELLENGEVHCFDIYIYKGQNVMNKNFEERYKLLKSVVDTLNVENIHMKTFYGDPEEPFLNTIEKINVLLQKRKREGYKTDGVIFTEVGKGISEARFLKLKPKDDQTIDFRIKIHNNRVKLMAGDINDKEIEFKNGLQIKNYDVITGFNGFVILDTEEYKDGDIVEFKWVKDTFVPVRHRQDKERPNFKKTAVSNFFIMKNEAYPEDIESLYNELLKNSSSPTKKVVQEEKEEVEERRVILSKLTPNDKPRTITFKGYVKKDDEIFIRVGGTEKNCFMNSFLMSIIPSFITLSKQIQEKYIHIVKREVFENKFNFNNYKVYIDTCIDKINDVCESFNLPVPNLTMESFSTYLSLLSLAKTISKDKTFLNAFLKAFSIEIKIEIAFTKCIHKINKHDELNPFLRGELQYKNYVKPEDRWLTLGKRFTLFTDRLHIEFKNENIISKYSDRLKEVVDKVINDEKETLIQTLKDIVIQSTVDQSFYPYLSSLFGVDIYFLDSVSRTLIKNRYNTGRNDRNRSVVLLYFANSACRFETVGKFVPSESKVKFMFNSSEDFIKYINTYVKRKKKRKKKGEIKKIFPIFTDVKEEEEETEGEEEIPFPYERDIVKNEWFQYFKNLNNAKKLESNNNAYTFLDFDPRYKGEYLTFRCSQQDFERLDLFPLFYVEELLNSCIHPDSDESMNFFFYEKGEEIYKKLRAKREFTKRAFKTELLRQGPKRCEYLPPSFILSLIQTFYKEGDVNLTIWNNDARWGNVITACLARNLNVMCVVHNDESYNKLYELTQYLKSHFSIKSKVKFLDRKRIQGQYKESSDMVFIKFNNDDEEKSINDTWSKVKMNGYFILENTSEGALDHYISYISHLNDSKFLGIIRYDCNNNYNYVFVWQKTELYKRRKKVYLENSEQHTNVEKLLKYSFGIERVDTIEEAGIALFTADKKDIIAGEQYDIRHINNLPSKEKIYEELKDISVESVFINRKEVDNIPFRLKTGYYVVDDEYEYSVHEFEKLDSKNDELIKVSDSVIQHDGKKEIIQAILFKTPLNAYLYSDYKHYKLSLNNRGNYSSIITTTTKSLKMGLDLHRSQSIKLQMNYIMERISRLSLQPDFTLSTYTVTMFVNNENKVLLQGIRSSSMSDLVNCEYAIENILTDFGLVSGIIPQHNMRVEGLSSYLYMCNDTKSLFVLRPRTIRGAMNPYFKNWSTENYIVVDAHFTHDAPRKDVDGEPTVFLKRVFLDDFEITLDNPHEEPFSSEMVIGKSVYSGDFAYILNGDQIIPPRILQSVIMPEIASQLQPILITGPYIICTVLKLVLADKKIRGSASDTSFQESRIIDYVFEGNQSLQIIKSSHEYAVQTMVPRNYMKENLLKYIYDVPAGNPQLKKGSMRDWRRYQSWSAQLTSFYYFWMDIYYGNNWISSEFNRWKTIHRNNRNEQYRLMATTNNGEVIGFFGFIHRNNTMEMLRRNKQLILPIVVYHLHPSYDNSFYRGKLISCAVELLKEYKIEEALVLTHEQTLLQHDPRNVCLHPIIFEGVSYNVVKIITSLYKPLRIQTDSS